MQRKKGISLIVLVITIIVMIILAGAIIITLNNSGIIAKANEAVDKTNEATMKEVANVAWAEAYADGVRKVETVDGVKGFEDRVKDALAENNIDTTGYNITVTISGVTIEKVKTEAELKAEYEEKYTDEIALALKYGEVVDGVYCLFAKHRSTIGGDPMEEAIPSAVTTLALPWGTTSVAQECFVYQQNGLKTIILPSTIKSIGSYAFAYSYIAEVEGLEYVNDFGSSAFNYCRNLKNVMLSEELTEIGYELFMSSGITSIEIPDSVITIGSSAFEFCGYLESVKLSKNLKRIEDRAFADTSIKSIVIPKSVTYIGVNAFSSCWLLEKIYYEGTEEEWTAIAIEEGDDALTNANIVYNYAE